MSAEVIPLDTNKRCANCEHWFHLKGPDGICRALGEQTNADYHCPEYKRRTHE